MELRPDRDMELAPPRSKNFPDRGNSSCIGLADLRLSAKLACEGGLGPCSILTVHSSSP